jgi:ABC-type transport system involved in cytochrome c biogenesis permease subunit
MIWTLFIAAALYILGLLHSIFGFYQKRLVFVRLALVMVGCGLISHTIFLILLGLEKHHFPITNLSESLSFFAWCITLIFVAANFRYKIYVLGASVLPLVSVLTIISQFIWEENHAIPQLLKSKWLYFHTTVAFLAYSAFFLTFISDPGKGAEKQNISLPLFPPSLSSGLR